MSRHPEVKWAQREDKVFITVLLADAKDPKVKLEPDGVFTFSGTAGAGNHSYELKLDLFDKVNVEESKINIGPRSIFCILEKAESKWWDKLLLGDAKTPHYVKVDWDKWVDKDDDTGSNDVNMGGDDFTKFGDMGGMGGMPGMGGMGGLAGMGGMGGMGGLEALAGMGGMGGMGGFPEMGGMPGMGDFMGDDASDDEVEEAGKPDGKDKEVAGGETKTEGASEGKAEATSST